MTKVKNSFYLSVVIILFVITLIQLVVPGSGKPVKDINGSWMKNMPVSLIHPLGTNNYAIDVLQQYSIALSNNLKYATVALISFLFFGTLTGISLGFRNRGGYLSFKKMIFTLKKETIILKIIHALVYVAVQTVQAIPLIIFVLVTVLIIQRIIPNPELRFYYDMLLVGLFMSPKLAVGLEERIKSLRDEEYVQAAKGMGISRFRLIFHYILWLECRGLILVQSANIMIQGIMIEIFLSYFNYGPQEDSLGRILKSGINFMAGYMTTGDHSFGLPFLQAIMVFILIVLLSLSLRWISRVSLEMSQ